MNGLGQGWPVYIDNGDAGDSGEIQINVDGHEYTEQENFSDQSNDVLDGYEVDTATGDHLAYLDTNHDGVADEVVEYDADGNLTSEAHFTDGHWVDDQGMSGGGSGGAGGGDPRTETGDGGGTGESISVDTAHGEVSIGQATVDSGNTGTPDTAVVHAANGDTILYTDTNHDGQADVATEISPDGQVVTAEHTGAGQWTEVSTGHLDAQGNYHQDATASGAFTPETGPATTSGTGPSSAMDTADDAHWSMASATESVTGAPATGTDTSASTADGLTAEDAGWTGAFSPAGAAKGVLRIDSATGQWISQN